MTGTWNASSRNKSVVVSTKGFSGGAYSLGGIIAGATLAACASAPVHASVVSTNTLLDRTAAAPVFIAREQDLEFSATSVLGEIRRRSAVTWQQIANMLSVSRRSVHAWAGGAAIKPEHQAKLQEMLDRVRSLGDLKAFMVRPRLLSSYGISEGSGEASSENAPILTADHTPLSAPIRIRRASAAVTQEHRG